MYLSYRLTMSLAHHTIPLFSQPHHLPSNSPKPTHSLPHLTPSLLPTENFALTEASYLTIRLIQSFPGRLESRDPEPWRELITFILSNLGGCKVGLFPARERREAREGESGRINEGFEIYDDE